MFLSPLEPLKMAAPLNPPETTEKHPNEDRGAGAQVQVHEEGDAGVAQEVQGGVLEHPPPSVPDGLMTDKHD